MIKPPSSLRLRLVTQTTIQYLAGFNDNPQEALKESVANALDANAKKIWVEVSRINGEMRLVVCDDGDGILDRMFEHDTLRLDQAYADQVKGVAVDFEELKMELSPVSRHSFEYMVGAIGLSAKTPGQGKIGMRGFGGTTAPYSYAHGKVVYNTRPSLELARSRYPNLKREPEVANYRLDMGGRESIGIIDPVLSLVDSPPTDPYRKPLVHGTRLEIYGVDPDFEFFLRPEALAEYFKRNLGQALRIRNADLVIVDKLSDKGLATGGIEHRVEPPVYKGYQIFTGTLFVEGGAPFNADLFLDPSERTPEIELYRRGDRAGSLFPRNAAQDIAFKEDPLLRKLLDSVFKRLKGVLHFPQTGDFEDDSDCWDTSKKRLLFNSPKSRRFVAALLKRETEFAEIVRRTLEQIDERREGEQARILGDALTAAIRETDYFRNKLGVKEEEPKRKIKPGKGPTRGPSKGTYKLEYVIVSVRNQNGEGVSGIPVQIWQSGQMLGEPRITKNSGSVSFGKKPKGAYRATIALPLEITAPLTSASFELPEDNEGVRVSFRVTTPVQVGTGVVKIPDIIPIIRPFSNAEDDPESPWHSRMNLGMVEINNSHPVYREAEAKGDWTRLAYQVHCLSSAVANHAGAGDRALTVQMSTILFARLMFNAQETERAARAKSAANRRK